MGRTRATVTSNLRDINLSDLYGFRIDDNLIGSDELESGHNVDTLWPDYLKNRIFAAFKRENARSVHKVTDFVDRHELINIADKYIKDMYANSSMLVRIQKETGETKTQSFKLAKSKPLIDEIDKILAKHYGFTEEELYFIINYDIKYRMGSELEGEK
jgi:hypothetical protein